MKLLCYGDSNTYGYDPRGFFGGRYDESEIWCHILGKALGCRVLNCGENGRTIPNTPREIKALLDTITREMPTILVLFLGTNDILTGKGTPEVISGRMEQLIKRLKQQFPELSILLLSPPPIGLPEFHENAQAVATGYRALAERENLIFLDSFHWDIPLTFDGIHFTQAGHQAFAAQLTAALKTI